MSKKNRLNPQSKRYAQRVNKAGDSPSVHGKTYRHKIACLRSLTKGLLTPIRKECKAEWRDGHRLIAAGLVTLEHKSEISIWIRPNEPMTQDYRNRLTLCLKGDDLAGQGEAKSSKDKDSFYNFDPKDKYNDQPDKAINMATIRFRNAKPPKKGNKGK